MVRTGLVARLVAIAAAWLACAEARGDAAIALVAPLTGPYAPFGSTVLSATKDAIAAYNASGPAQRVVLKATYDDACTPTQGRVIAERIARDPEIVAVIGHCPATLGEVAPLYEASRIPLISPSAHVWLRGRGGIQRRAGESGNVLRLGMTAEHLATAVLARIRYPTAPGERPTFPPITVFHDEDPFTEAFVAELRRSIGTLREVPCTPDADAGGPISGGRTIIVAREPDRCAHALRRSATQMVHLVAVPNADTRSWKRLWQRPEARSPFITVFGLFEGLDVTPLGRRVAAARKASEPPPRAYTLAVASVELVGGSLDALAPSPAVRPDELRRSLRPQLLRPHWTVLGVVGSPNGEPRVPYAVYPAESHWTPEGWVGSARPWMISVREDDRALVGADGGDAPKSGEGVRAFWNAWFDRDGNRATRLDPGRRYRFVLDLSRFESSVKPSKAVTTQLEDAVRKASFVVRVMLLGGKAETSEPSPAVLQRTLEVVTERLKQGKLEDEKSGEKESAARRERKLDVDRYLAEASAGHVAFDVDTVEEGCGAIAMSVWDERGLKPLDHLTYEFAVGPAVTCPRTDILTGGAARALTLSGSLKGAESADAAIHVFELPSDARDPGSIVMLVQRREYESGKDGSRGVYGWQTQSSILRYLTTASQLPASIDAARKAATAKSDDPYASVAGELRLKLFSERGKGDGAARALGALKAAIDDSTGDATIILRVAASPERLGYLPLSLLAARGGAPTFKKTFLTVQPLRRERLEGSDACVARWTLAMPTRLEGVDSPRLAQYVPPPGPWVRQATVTALVEWLAPAKNGAPAPATPGGEGLVVVAHHDAGILWFDKRADHVVKENFSRSLGPGGFALVAACSVGGVGPFASELIEVLNDRDVDAMIVSPFPVSPAFGIELAAAFVNQLAKARAAKRTVTLGELYGLAVHEVEERFAQAPGLAEMRLEFVLLGDPGIRICP